MLTLTGVTKSYGSLKILDGVDLEIAAGESTALIGESGSGKSTLLHLIAALDTPDTGTIRIGETDVTSLSEQGRATLRRTGLALVFQQFNLIPSLTIEANIAFQARLAGAHDPAWCQTLAERLGLTDLFPRYPEQVSGGQAQRTAIARALALKPPLLLADEPTGNLDEATGDAVLDLMLDLVAETGTTLLFVTHSPRLAARLNRTVRIQAGKITEATPPTRAAATAG